MIPVQHWESPQDLLGDLIKYKPEITFNRSRTYDNGKKAPDGIEIRFGKTRPTEELRNKLKAAGFKFSEKQKIWYAYDNSKSQSLISTMQEQEVDVDDTQYEKKNFWAEVKSKGQYAKFYNRTEFRVKTFVGDQFFYTKSALEKAHNVPSIIAEGTLSFKKFFNKVISDEEIEEEQTDDSQENDEEDFPEQVPDKPNSSVTIADKLLALAEGMEKKIQEKLNPAIARQNPTRRRAAIIESMYKEGAAMQSVQRFLKALSIAHRNGSIGNYHLLQKIKTKKDAELVGSYSIKWNDEERLRRFSWNSDELMDLGIYGKDEWLKAHIQKDELQEAAALPNPTKPTIEKQITDLERDLIGRKIPGFFPSPTGVCINLVGRAELQPTDRILEPSAGKGDILDEIKSEQNGRTDNLYAIEINHSLREILSLKGYEVIANDFLQFNPESVEKFDKIIMNPPFENGQDIDHVLHALKCLKPTGRVVAVVSEGVFFRSYKKDQGFRELLSSMNAYISNPIKDAFKSSFNPTGVAVRIIAINKDGLNPRQQKEKREKEQGMSEEEKLLEIQALAEIELLKIQLELKNSKSALQGIDQDLLQHLEQIAWSKKNKWEVLNFR